MSAPQAQSRRHWLGWAIYGVLVLIMLVEGGAILYYAKLHPLYLDFQCDNNFMRINRAIDRSRIWKLDYYPDELPMQESLPLSAWRCPVCGAPYIYRPVPPSGERITHSGKYHFFLWDPCLHSKAGRAMMFTNGTWCHERDEDVSWYYQEGIYKDEPLTREQFAKENEYRKKMHIPLLESPKGTSGKGEK